MQRSEVREPKIRSWTEYGQIGEIKNKTKSVARAFSFGFSLVSLGTKVQPLSILPSG